MAAADAGRERAAVRPALTVRPERPDDHAAVTEVVTLAFGQPDEADLVGRIRESDRFVAELSLVAEVDGAVVGHALFSYVDLAQRRVLELAPLAVQPAHQGRGIGTALVEVGLAAARERDEPAVLVLGDPAYYGRFGFTPAAEADIHPPPGIDERHFMVRTLGGHHADLRGEVQFPPAFGMG